MRDIPLSLLREIPFSFDEVKRFEIPEFKSWLKEQRGKVNTRDWKTTPKFAELVEWVFDNLSSTAELVFLFNNWVISASNRDDLVLLTLKFGQQK